MVGFIAILQVQCFDTALTPVQLCFPNEEQVVDNVAIVMVVGLVSVFVIVEDACRGRWDGHLW